MTKGKNSEKIKEEDFSDNMLEEFREREKMHPLTLCRCPFFFPMMRRQPLEANGKTVSKMINQGLLSLANCNTTIKNKTNNR